MRQNMSGDGEAEGTGDRTGAADGMGAAAEDIAEADGDVDGTWAAAEDIADGMRIGPVVYTLTFNILMAVKSVSALFIFKLCVL